MNILIVGFKTRSAKTHNLINYNKNLQYSLIYILYPNTRTILYKIVVIKRMMMIRCQFNKILIC